MILVLYLTVLSMRMGLPLKLVEIVKVAFGILLMTKKGWCGASSAQQRFLHAILTQCPTTAGSVQFCLLCCQPEPVPRSLAARRSQLTLRDPCRLPAWSGRTIHMASRTYCAPMHSCHPSQVTDQGPHCSSSVPLLFFRKNERNRLARENHPRDEQNTLCSDDLR